MNKKLKLVIVGVLLFGGMAVVGIGYVMYNKPHTNVSTSKAGIITSAEALVQDFETNEMEANTKYLDQIIEIKGTVADIGSVKGNLVISVGEQAMFGNVKCHFNTTETEKNYDVKKGQTITVKGICTGYLMDVILVNAVLIK